mgnify:CR=1 FL=1
MSGQATALNLCRNWFEDQGWKPFSFQIQAWSAALNGECGIVNAPTGSGKTYSLLLPAIAAGMARSGREDALQQVLIPLHDEALNQPLIVFAFLQVVHEAKVDLFLRAHLSQIGFNLLAHQYLGVAQTLIQRVEELDEHVSVARRI